MINKIFFLKWLSVSCFLASNFSSVTFAADAKNTIEVRNPTALQSFLQLSVDSLGTGNPTLFVFFDIDFTLVKPAFHFRNLTAENYHAAMSQVFGTAYFDPENPAYSRVMDFLADTGANCDFDAFMTVESSTAELIDELQKRGVYVYGLTARQPDHGGAENTEHLLEKLGIDFCQSPLGNDSFELADGLEFIMG